MAFSKWWRLVLPIFQALHHAKTPRQHLIPFPWRWQVAHYVHRRECVLASPLYLSYISFRGKSKCPQSPGVFYRMERALLNFLPRNLWFNSQRDIGAGGLYFVCCESHRNMLQPLTELLTSSLTDEYTKRSRKESWQGPWQTIAGPGNQDSLPRLLGSHFSHVNTQPTGQGNFTILWSTALGICSGTGDCVYFGDQLCIPRLPFSSAFLCVKYSTVYYHFIPLQLFPLTVVRGSLDSESLPLSNSICLNVKKEKKK